MHFKRITHHAIWFTLLGPFVGVPAAIMTLAFAESNKSQFLFEVAQVLMLLMFVGWLVGAIPALLTGIAVACLPGVIYDYHWRRILCSGLIGAAVAFIGPALFEGRILYFLAEEMLWSITNAGLFSGLVMGWAVVSLSGFTRPAAQKEFA